MQQLVTLDEVADAMDEAMASFKAQLVAAGNSPYGEEPFSVKQLTYLAHAYGNAAAVVRMGLWVKVEKRG